MKRVAVLVSGHGSNLQAILDAVQDGTLASVEVVLVLSNRREAFAIQRAIRRGVPALYFPLAPYSQAGLPREDYDAALASILRAFDADWVVLAGWMHVLSHAFLEVFPSRVVNLHPALPGTFPGTHAIDRAFSAFQQGEISHTGVMVHLVPDEAVDAGPVVAQVQVPIHPQDSLEDLEARIHANEHRLLVQALQKLLC